MYFSVCWKIFGKSFGESMTQGRPSYFSDTWRNACTNWLNIIKEVTFLGGVHIQSKCNILKPSSCVRLREEQRKVYKIQTQARKGRCIFTGDENTAKIKQNQKKKKVFCITHKLLMRLSFYKSYKPIILRRFFNCGQFYASPSLHVTYIVLKY